MLTTFPQGRLPPGAEEVYNAAMNVGKYDVVVVGAGPAGSACAWELARHGVRVLLLDKSEFPRDKTCGDGLTPRAVSVLEGMGLAREVAGMGGRVSQVRVVGPGGTSTTLGMPGRGGLVVPRLRLDDALLRRATSVGAEFEAPARAEAVELEGQHALVRLEDGRGVRARMVVVATGASPRLLERSGLVAARPRLLAASRAYFECPAAQVEEMVFSFQGVTLPGYGWIFPLGGERFNVGAGVLARHEGSTARKEFEAFTRSRLCSRLLPGARREGPVRGFPLRTDFLRSRLWAPGVIMVGEAAGLVNPLTGEGIDYALESGVIAGRHVREMLSRGEIEARAYERELRSRFSELFRTCERLRWLCRSRLAVHRLVTAADRHEDLRRMTARIVLGLEAEGRVPVAMAAKALVALLGA